jgi:hypothetical protein
MLQKQPLLYNYTDKLRKIIIILNKGIRNTYNILENLQLKPKKKYSRGEDKRGTFILLSQYVRA